jgi:hypothetical protein
MNVDSCQASLTSRELPFTLCTLDDNVGHTAYFIAIVKSPPAVDRSRVLLNVTTEPHKLLASCRTVRLVFLR